MLGETVPPPVTSLVVLVEVGAHRRMGGGWGTGHARYVLIHREVFPQYLAYLTVSHLSWPRVITPHTGSFRRLVVTGHPGREEADRGEPDMIAWWAHSCRALPYRWRAGKQLGMLGIGGECQGPH